MLFIEALNHVLKSENRQIIRLSFNFEANKLWLIPDYTVINKIVGSD